MYILDNTSSAIDPNFWNCTHLKDLPTESEIWTESFWPETF